MGLFWKSKKQKQEEHRRKYEIQVERVSKVYNNGDEPGYRYVNVGMLPAKKNPKDAGFDLFATDDLHIQPGTVIKHPLNIRMKLPEGCYAEIKSKSGLGSKGLLVYAGVIDEEYRGIPHVVATNVLTSPPIPCNLPKEDESFDPRQTVTVAHGDKLAQMVLFPYSTEYYIVEVDRIDTDTARGTGGFGSTGK